MARARREPFSIGGTDVLSGRRSAVELPIAKLVTGSPLSMPVLVKHGKFDGPTVWINAAIHGDEVSGVEIIRRVLDAVDQRTLRGTLLAVPILNVPGFMNGNRYLPDRRDLNRSFPGSTRGSLASRIAKLFMTEVVAQCSVGIDIHTGSDHRTNLPQIRGNFNDEETRRLAKAFGAPVMLQAANRSGSLRHAGSDAGATVLLYEGGEAWRFEEPSIRQGFEGTLRVLAALDMIDLPKKRKPPTSKLCLTSTWVRARRGGLAQFDIGLGDEVAAGDQLGLIHDAFGTRLSRVTTRKPGIIVGLSLDPIVNQGDALVHIAQPEETVA